MTVGSAAPRTTRPRNRRALIVSAGTELFFDRGYDKVGVSDIAEAVGIGPSALYRHFAGKQALLREVLTSALVPFRATIETLDLTDRTTGLPQLAVLALEHRRLGVLWQREARHVAPSDFTDLRVELSGIGQLLASRLRHARPDLSPAAADLLAWSILGVLMSTSFHRLDLPMPEYTALLTDLIGTVVDTPLPRLPDPGPPAPGPPGLVPHSRREAMLTQAVRMFARDGYTGVGIEDIGAAVGIAGASLYNHFDTKAELLVTALRRGTAVLSMELTTIYGTATDPAAALTRLVASYVGFSRRHHDLIDLMITELGHLPDNERHDARQAQHDYVSEWAHLLRAARPELGPTAARIRVHAALAVANDTARTPHLRHNPATEPAARTLCLRLLGIPDSL
ncbi:TetR/AcrR family transcriptional regulator [Streptomyces sp. NPDC056835]|uniref:TetR/AcrR family transcriptional regulator n=1 Tax=Streptomyces sp. NPDC056835 TaxID=3345956 RepID=UPI0036CEF0D8